MATAKDRLEWQRSKQMVEYLRSSWGVGERLPARAMDPYYEEPEPPTPEENKRMMQDYLAGLDARFGPRG